ncbi:MAG: restriction endonuclease subunit S [bacterium]|nr:restriction endonuclease subunit S [bacterium]
MSEGPGGIQLPNGWRRVRLGEICALNPRAAPSLARPDEALTAFVPMSAVDERLGRITRFELRPYAEVRKGHTFFAEGDVMFAKITPCMQNGKHAVVRGLTDGIGFGSTEFHVLRPGLEVTSEWIHHFMRQPHILTAAMAHFYGTVGQQRVPEGFLASLEIPLPSLAEQRRIVALLEECMAQVERARAAAEDRLRALEALPDACLRGVFNGFTPLSVSSNVDATPFGWSWRRLTDIARLESGHTPSRYHPEWWGGPIHWIALPDIRQLDGKIAFETSEHTNEAGIANSSARVLPARTVVLSRTASVGFVTVMGREMATSQDFVNWVCGPEIDPVFLAYLLRASRDYIRSLASGAVHNTVYMPTVKAFHVCIPSLSAQKQIVAMLDDQMASIEKARLATDAELEGITVLPAAILRRAFAGELQP